MINSGTSSAAHTALTVNTAKAVYIFDVDRTVIKKTSAEYFLRTALRGKYIRFSQIKGLLADLIKYKLARANNDFIENAVKKLCGLNNSDIEKISQICFEEKIKPNIFTEASSLINELQKNGEKVIFATSSFDFIIRPLEKYFCIEGSLASRLEYKDGVTTGNLDGKSLFGQRKKQAAMEWMSRNCIEAKDAVFYSDSYTDIPLLECCGYPVAVNPDRILKQKAIKSGWKILKFKKVLGKN